MMKAVVKASQAKNNIGLPSLALETVKLTAKPSFGKFASGLGKLPDVIQPPPQTNAPQLPSGLTQIKPTSAMENTSRASKVEATDDKSKLVVAASTLAASFIEGSNNVKLNDNDSQHFLDISKKILKCIESIEKNLIDEQDTSITHASSEPATTIVQEPFLPTEVPGAQSDPLSKLLSIAGAAVGFIGSALMSVYQWLGSMWTNFTTKLAQQVKQLFDLGWSKVVTGFTKASEWMSNCVGTITSWVDNSIAKVSTWIKTAADKIKSIWNMFDLSKLNILDFNLSGLWAKMQDLSIFGDWGNALKNALNIFGGTGLDTLKWVFDVAGKVWDMAKPVVGILAKVARFMGPIGMLFGLATMASDFAGLLKDASAIIGAKTPEARTDAAKDLFANAMRVIASAILPEFMVNSMMGNNKDEVTKEAVSSGALKQEKSWFGSDYKITDVSKLESLTVEQLQALLDSNNLDDDDEKVVEDIIKRKKDTQAEVVKDKPTVIIPQNSQDTTSYEWNVVVGDVLKTTVSDRLSYNPNATESEIERIINDTRTQLYNRYVKSGEVSQNTFNREFNSARDDVLKKYYSNYNTNAVKNAEVQINNNLIHDSSSENETQYISSTVLNQTTTEGTINITNPNPVLVEPQVLTPVKDTTPDTEVTSNGSQRAAAASDFATRHAAPKSTGYCARFVANSLQASGYRFNRNGTAKEYVTNGTLQRLGFAQVSLNEEPQKGDISVMGPRYPGHAGHISIFNGINWVSDFVQRHESPYNGGKPLPGQWMTRWRDTGNNSDTQMTFQGTEYYNSYDNTAVASIVDLSQISSSMSSVLNQALSVLGLQVQETVKEPPKSQMTMSESRANLELDELLLLKNGFD